MSTKIRSGGRFSIPGKDGQPANGWKVETFTAGSAGVLGTDDKATYTDYTLGTEHSNPIILDERGEKEIWWDGTYLIRIRDASNNLIYTLDYFGQGEDDLGTPDIPPINGSFEDSDTPVNWTISEETGGTISVDTTDAAHGQNCLKFVGTTNGGGTSESDKFPVEAGEYRELSFIYNSSSATTLNSVDIKWFNHAGTNISTSSLYSEGVSNPSSFTKKYAGVNVPATAVKASILITGINSGGTTVSATVKFDNVQFPVIGTDTVKQIPVTSQVNRLKVTGAATGDKPRIGSNGEANTGLIIEDSNGNPVIVAESVANAVNYHEETNSATGNAIKSAAAGTDTNIDRDIDAKGTGAINLAGTSTGPVNVRATPVYGLVILDEPELLASGLTRAAWTTINSTTLGNANAQKAIIKICVDVTQSTLSLVDAQFHIRKTGTTLIANTQTRILNVSNGEGTIDNGSKWAYGDATGVVNLDSNSDFDYYFLYLSGSTVNEDDLYLVGYYV